MKGEFYRSYNTFAMYPVTIHCKGMKYKNATILSAGFASFGCDSHRVSAYITLKNGSPELAKEILELLNNDGNFVREDPSVTCFYSPQF